MIKNNIWTSIKNITEKEILGKSFLMINTINNEILLAQNDKSITKISAETLSEYGPTPNKPWGKYMEYITIAGLKFVTCMENRTVDIAPISTDNKIFLIKRKDKNGVIGGIALPGGHIDPPETSEQAAYRELGEETFNTKNSKQFVYSMNLLYNEWINEETALGKEGSDHTSKTLAYIARINDDAINKMKAYDDAEDGKWYTKDEIPYDKFHFLHHIDIVKYIFGDPIHKKGKSWYFWDKIWAHEIGPFNTRKQCEENTTDYYLKIKSPYSVFSIIKI